jgi:hypothetical protein
MIGNAKLEIKLKEEEDFKSLKEILEALEIGKNFVIYNL